MSPKRPVASPTPEPQVLAPPGKRPPRGLWRCSSNDHIDKLPTEKIALFKPSGNLREDFLGLCTICGVVPHPAFSPPRTDVIEDEDKRPGPLISVQAFFFDHCSIDILRLVLPSAHHLETIRLSGCKLDIDMLVMLRSGLTDASTVTTVHIDWNPVELPPDVVAMRPGLGEDVVDEFEQKRERLQKERRLRVFGELLGYPRDVETALLKVAQKHTPSVPDLLEVLDSKMWSQAFLDALGFAVDDSGEAFDILDSHPFGRGERLLWLGRLKEALSALPRISVEEEANDPVGAAFAGFADASCVLEFVSFRHCALSRVEAQCLGTALSGSQHLRALNLSGNRIEDRGAAALGDALEHNFGLQCLSLAHNWVTEIGLESLCQHLGVRWIAKTEADKVLKRIKEQTKERDKREKEKEKSKAPTLKVDANGRPRYTPQPQIEQLEERMEIQSGVEKKCWVHRRNVVLNVLNLERNRIADAEVVKRLQPSGVGDLVLRNNPCVPRLPSNSSTARDGGMPVVHAKHPDAVDEKEGCAGSEADSSTLTQEHFGWNLVF